MTLNTIGTLALAFATFNGLADAHIKLASPVPYGKATLDTSPLKDAKPGSAGSDFPCKQRSGVYDLTERTQVVAGADNPLTFDGSATHGGGSGFLAVTTDEHPDVNSQWKTFMVFDSGMPVKGDSESGSGTSSYTYVLPKGMLNGNLTLGWYWYNRIGNRELYSNCAPLEISGGSDNRSVFDALPNAYLINLPTSECSSQEMGDTEIPNPGNAVVVKGGGTSMLAATGPSCAASAAAVTKGVAGGSDSGPATSAASPTSAPLAFAPTSYSGSPVSNMTSAAASPVSSPSGGEIGNSASGSSPGSFLTISTAVASSPAGSSAYPTMTPSSAGIAAPTGYPAAANGSSSSSSSSSGSGSSSGSSSSDGISCSSDGKQYGQVVAGSTVWRDVAAGTSCSNGQIIKRSLMRHAHAKPSCRRCTSTGRKCDGYVRSDLPNKAVSSPPFALCTNPTSNALERRTFDFFRFRTLDCVSGYFVDPLWDRLVLQCCESEPVVRHAVNAFAALHEERFHRDATIKDGSGALQVQGSFPALQYSKALQGLQSILRAQNVSVDLIMMCILLMVHFESLRECYVPALVHIEHAIQLLHSSGSFDPSKIDPSLLRALMRLDIQGSLYLGARVPGLAFYTIALDNTLPTEIHDVMQARDLLNTWISRLFHFMRVYADEYKFDQVGMAPLEVVARSQELARIFAEIDRLLWDFMHQPTLKLNIREQHGLAVLRSRAKVNRIVAACSIYAETSIYDAYLTEFDEILNICTYVMGSDNADRRLFSVSLDEGLLSPLHFVALHCRDSRIRRSALAHLQRLPTKAGIWHVEAITRTTQMCVDFEEKWSGKPSPQCQDIPEWRRLHMAVFDGWVLQRVQPAVKARYRLRPNGMDGEWMEIEKKLEWEPGVQSDVEQLSDTFDLLAKIEDIDAQGQTPVDPVGYTEMHYRLQEKMDRWGTEGQDETLSTGIAAVLRRTHAATAASGPRLGRNFLNRHRLKLELA
ncbi:hypothetical protein LTR12_009527 [Friedmanniomyces endolithicus]|nr:hypothetical protein LTR12_009527 [Friedmanniomyces endolithicus]